MNQIDMIFYKKMNQGDLFNIDREPGSISGGGGQTYIDLAGIDDETMQEFLKYGVRVKKENDYKNRSIISIKVKSIGNTNEEKIITFDPRNNRPNYRIVNQHRDRHPSWSSLNGFPTIPTGASRAADVNNIPNLVIYIARTIEGEYFAGYINEENMPDEWPNDFRFESMFTGDRKGFIRFECWPTLVKDILESLDENPNILLYGPPGTGKTYTMQYIWSNINNLGRKTIILDELNLENPFSEYELNTSINNPRVEWLTFHQNFTYEDFVIGMRPKSSGVGIELEPKAGILMDIIASIKNGDNDSAIIFIDELNRGNVSRIFGQIITFLEMDKREDLINDDNSFKLPISFPQLAINGDKMEDVTLINGQKYAFDFPLYFPRPIYIIATMNSVDKSIAPIDSAILRRFKEIELNVDYKFLGLYLGIDSDTIDEKTSNFNASEIAYKLLKKVNDFISITMGADFQLGNSYIISIAQCSDEESKLKSLWDIWNKSILPQIIRLIGNNQEVLIELLKAETATEQNMEWYPYKVRQSLYSSEFSSNYILDRNNIIINDSNIIKQIMEFLIENE